MNSRTPLILLLPLVLMSACGGDEPEEAEFRSPPAAANPPPAQPRPDTAAAEPPPAAPAGEGMVDAASLGARIYTVQIGAFRRPANATRLVSRLREAGFPVWETTYQADGGPVSRVRVGATTTAAAARSLGAMVEQRYGVPFWVAPVPPDTRLPASILEDTRRAGGS